MKIGFGTEALQIFVVRIREIAQMKVIFVKEGHWVDYSTQLPPSTPIPWLHISEPTGFIGWVFNFTFKPSRSPIPKMWFSSLLSAENCSGFSHPSLRKTAYDLDCRQKHSTVCQGSISLLKIFRGWEKSLSRTQCLNFGWGGSALLPRLTPCTSCARIWVR